MKLRSFLLFTFIALFSLASMSNSELLELAKRGKWLEFRIKMIDLFHRGQTICLDYGEPSIRLLMAEDADLRLEDVQEFEVLAESSFTSNDDNSDEGPTINRLNVASLPIVSMFSQGSQSSLVVGRASRMRDTEIDFLRQRSQERRIENQKTDKKIKAILGEIERTVLNARSPQDAIHEIRVIVFTLHNVLSPCEEVRFLTSLFELIQRFGPRSTQAYRMFNFILFWVQQGRPLCMDASVELKIFLSQVQSALNDKILNALNFDDMPLLHDFPLLGWMHWQDDEIAIVLTDLAGPFFRIRACEFGAENRHGPNLTLLCQRARAVSRFVTASILEAAKGSRSDAVAILVRWINIASELLRLGNYEFALAIQSGIARNQLERLEWLTTGLSRREEGRLNDLNRLFNVENRMREAVELIRENAGRTAIIPTIYWFLGNAIRLRETPVILDNGELNHDRMLAANHIFDFMITAQQVRYPVLDVNEDTRWYFNQMVEHADGWDDETLYEYSDQAKGSPTSRKIFTLKPKKSNSAPGDLQGDGPKKYFPKKKKDSDASK